ncbi:PA14 domain-containing protein [Maribacter sp. 2307ULW6-5]|uniref:PA14 domain-containing protein n=1 Tax=Maribacter sp. 2307ULW6-5 TaxID=3386275 RepID=UPI0039BC5D6F
MKPWTNKPFYNNPENFQFAVVSDRTGGHRKGVFGSALKKINTLYPEFVISVGDLIEGYSKDERIIDQQWEEFHGILDSLETRFFYVAGNHDYSNEVMAKQWKNRYGRDFYHFLYKDVLFLILNSNDGDGVLMGEGQIQFLKEIISKHTEVRWTMIFMHHPLWVYGEANGFSEVEEALQGRDYTVFAGHTHRFMQEVRNDQNHYVLGTTGGGSQLRGAKFGEFDHIGWITMTDSGPKLANLALSGILEHDVSNVANKGLANSLIETADLKPLVLSKAEERKVVLLLQNSADRPIHFRAQAYHHHQVAMDSSFFEIEVPAQSSKQLTIKTRPLEDGVADRWDPLELQWEMGYHNSFTEPDFALSGTEIIELQNTTPLISMTEQNIFLKEMTVAIEHPYTGFSLNYTLNGAKPNTGSSTRSTSFDIVQSTAVMAKLIDGEGFESEAVEVLYEKVKPTAGTKVKQPRKGLAYAYYEDTFDSVPDFKGLVPKKTGFVTDLSPDKIGERLDHYAIQYAGYVEIPKTGVYTFYLKSDDGSKLYVHDKLFLDNDGSHSAKTKEGSIALKKGFHPIHIDYFEDFLHEALELHYSSGEMGKRPVPLWHQKP